MTKEVNREQWAEVCGKISQECAGTLVTVSEVDAAGGRSPIIRAEPLDSIEFSERKGKCSDSLQIKAGAAEHSIVEPVYIRLKNGTTGRYTRLEILSESGGIVVEMDRGIPAI